MVKTPAQKHRNVPKNERYRPLTHAISTYKYTVPKTRPATCIPEHVSYGTYYPWKSYAVLGVSSILRYIQVRGVAGYWAVDIGTNEKLHPADGSRLE